MPSEQLWLDCCSVEMTCKWCGQPCFIPPDDFNLTHPNPWLKPQHYKAECEKAESIPDAE